MLNFDAHQGRRLMGDNLRLFFSPIAILLRMEELFRMNEKGAAKIAT